MIIYSVQVIPTHCYNKRETHKDMNVHAAYFFHSSKVEGDLNLHKIQNASYNKSSAYYSYINIPSLPKELAMFF